LYDTLGSDQAKVLTGKEIVDIISTDSGVTVKCSDGTLYEGSIVIGADGVHSKVRSIMRRLALEEDPTRSWDAEKPYLTTYKCLWFSTPSLVSEQDLSGCPDMTVYETYHKDHSIMCLSGKQRCWAFLYKKLPQPTTQRLTYSKEDMEETINAFADFPITEDVKVREAYNRRINSSMASIEEGMTNHWSWGRIVLIGDSCHKYAPNLGYGYQGGLQDVVALCNRLHSAVDQAPDGMPSTTSLSQVFQSYHAFRREPANRDAKLSAFVIRTTAWDNFFYYFLSLYILPTLWADYVLQNWVFPPIDRRMLVLDYVEAEEPFTGRVSWVYKMPAPSRAKEE
jgi:2-polyprenyl-6-methoxyphenol hydroxylase-like FAD-dependent oxidoreductase